MKHEQQQQAQYLFFQTDLSKTEIADQIGISRRSLQYWVKQNNWDRIRQNARHMPSLITEKCYHILSNYADSLLSVERKDNPPTSKEIDSMYKLTLTLNKLKGRASLNESMESIGWLMESINASDPALANQVMPFVSNHISNRAAANHTTYMPSEFLTSGHLPAGSESGSEDYLDLRDEEALQEEMAAKVNAGKKDAIPGANQIQPARKPNQPLSAPTEDMESLFMGTQRRRSKEEVEMLNTFRKIEATVSSAPTAHSSTK